MWGIWSDSTFIYDEILDICKSIHTQKKVVTGIKKTGKVITMWFLTNAKNPKSLLVSCRSSIQPVCTNGAHCACVLASFSRLSFLFGEKFILSETQRQCFYFICIY